MIASRYARALFAEACLEDREKEIYDQMRCFNSSNENPQVGAYISNPNIPAEFRTGLIIAACGAEKGSLMDRFTWLLLSNDRITHMKHIARIYCDIYRKAKGIRNITVTVADDRIVGFEELFGSTDVEIDSRIDPSLIGGFVCREGSQQLDASVRGQLDKITKELCRTTLK
jgi:F-type H+-transporting ATPase subunit delta